MNSCLGVVGFVILTIFDVLLGFVAMTLFATFLLHVVVPSWHATPFQVGAVFMLLVIIKALLT